MIVRPAGGALMSVKATPDREAHETNCAIYNCGFFGCLLHEVNNRQYTPGAYRAITINDCCVAYSRGIDYMLFVAMS